MKLTTRWNTACTVGYTASVSREENRSAHGGVTHVQVRRGARGIIARKVNSNGRHQEVGATFTPTAEQIQHWANIDRATR